jgi:hypothetical protein
MYYHDVYMCMYYRDVRYITMRMAMRVRDEIIALTRLVLDAGHDPIIYTTVCVATQCA